MNKIIILILCLCCAFTIARAEEGPALNPIGREHCRSCGGPENRRTFVLYYDLFERDDYRDFD